MNNYFRIAVLAGGASLMAAGPVFAQDLNALNPLGGLDLDPFHIFTPAPAPAAPAAAAPHRHRKLHHAAAHHAAAPHAAHHVAARHAAKAHLAKS